MFDVNGFRFLVFPQSSAAWTAMGSELSLPGVVNSVHASGHHLTELPLLIAEQRLDRLIIDCCLLGALALVDKGELSIPCSAYQHSVLTGRTASEETLHPFAHAMRQRAGLPPILSLPDCTRQLTDRCVSILVASIVPLEQQPWGAHIDAAVRPGGCATGWS